MCECLQLCFSDSGIANCICKLTSNMMGNLWGTPTCMDWTVLASTKVEPCWNPDHLGSYRPYRVSSQDFHHHLVNLVQTYLPPNPDKSLVPSDAWYGPSDLDRWTLWSSRDLLARDLDWTDESSPGELTTGALPTEATAKCNSLEPLDGFSAMVGTNHSDFQWVIGLLANAPLQP